MGEDILRRFLEEAEARGREEKVAKGEGEMSTEVEEEGGRRWKELGEG